ncbi:hypothetical protein TSUD_213870 [Trifolium subterraneum]|uniref:Uncharacterized protein n=1 Tax=Trifolium subterraneum TaxID=3900 RepID=A0A2Z6N4H3_TRISU|nr:hypothetical protein TSUD_213870 [Trifolium subterraneum]
MVRHQSRHSRRYDATFRQPRNDNRRPSVERFPDTRVLMKAQEEGGFRFPDTRVPDMRESWDMQDVGGLRHDRRQQGINDWRQQHKPTEALKRNRLEEAERVGLGNSQENGGGIPWQYEGR